MWDNNVDVGRDEAFATRVVMILYIQECNGTLKASEHGRDV